MIIRKHHIVPKSKHKASKIRPLIIAITGTPGVGKTHLARKLSLLLHGTYIDLNKLALESGLMIGKDTKRHAVIIDESRLYSAIRPLFGLNKLIIADSHTSHFLPRKALICCVVVHCSLPELRRRLRSRNYSFLKIKENLEAELFGIIQSEAEEMGHRIILIDSTSPLNSREIKKICSAMVRT